MSGEPTSAHPSIASPPPVPAGAPAGIAHAIGSRNLIIIIIIMPLVFIAMVMATIAIFGRPGEKDARARAAAPPEGLIPLAAATTPPGAAIAFPATPLVIPAGAEIGAMALDGDRLILRVSGGLAEELVVYDIAKGALVQRIPVIRELSAGGP